MQTKTVSKKANVGEDECEWWSRVEAVAANWRCTVVSYRGPMWKCSKGREIVYAVTSHSKTDWVGFATARPE